MSLGINDVSIGFSASGTQDYVSNLNSIAITQTKEKLAQIEGIRTALQKGWEGKAQENFIANFQKSIVKTQQTLDTIEKTLVSQFSTLTETWQQQDAEMVPLD